jgi:hypothetical protein
LALVPRFNRGGQWATALVRAGAEIGQMLPELVEIEVRRQANPVARVVDNALDGIAKPHR